MFDAPIHGNLWIANILIHEGELFLIDFCSVTKLSLEYDLLYANRTITRRVEAWVKGWCSLDTKYIKHYGEYGEKARAIIKILEENNSFDYALHAAFKIVSSIRANKLKLLRDFCEKIGKALHE